MYRLIKERRIKRQIGAGLKKRNIFKKKELKVIEISKMNNLFKICKIACVRYDRIYLEYCVKNVKEFLFKKKFICFLNIRKFMFLFLYVTTSKDRCLTKIMCKRSTM